MDLLEQMRTFVRVVESNKLSAAARAQRMSLSAVSRQLRALERELGVALIVRSTRRLHVTDAGRLWHGHCVRILRELSEAQASVRSPDVVRGKLVVSASLTFGSVLVVPKLPALVRACPELQIDLRLEDHLVDLVSEGVDVALRAGAPAPDSTAYVAHPLVTMARVLVASPAWLKRHGVPRTIEDLARADSLVQVTPKGSTIRWLLRSRTRPAERHNLEPRGLLRSNAPLALRDWAQAGAGIAYVPDWLVREQLHDGTLKQVLPDWTSPPITAWAVHRAELRGTANLKALLTTLRA
ncbi:MAG TPA: LysR family transcriptional regulator [Polyangiales bacterium]